MKSLSLSILLFGVVVASVAQTPEWIWFRKSDAAESRFFRKTLTLDATPDAAELVVTADDEFTAFINGDRTLSAAEWSRPRRVDVKAKLRAGRNVIAIRANNGDSSPAGLLVRLVIKTGGSEKLIVSDATWKAEDRQLEGWNRIALDDAGWSTAASLGKVGVEPWGNVLATPAAQPAVAATRKEATPATSLYVPEGFKVELVHTAEPEEGSWVNLCRDPKGRLIVSPQYRDYQPDAGLIRITLDGDGRVARREVIARSLYDAQGMVFANGALWVVVNKYSTRHESGLYKITDDGSDTWSRIELVRKLPGGGEHGPHAVELGPDGNLWVMAGNHTKPPADLSPLSPHKNYQEDHVLPRQPDGNGHATGVMAPGGYICRVSPDGARWEFFCGGFRNQFDFTFNVDGELFVYDADMEYDWGVPWYRPTRINHAVSGAEFGWRYGTGKWPDDYPDSVGTAVDIGIGCPTGVGNGKGSRFPAKYQRAIYAMDWTYGRLMAVHLKPDGAGYTGTWENFIAPAGLVKPGQPKPPLNVTDLVIGNDGAMYFTIGGRGTAAGLYRVSYNGSESTAPAWIPNQEGADARRTRRMLESYHGRENSEAIAKAWPHLNSSDRALRYAARIAVESQPLPSWVGKALSEPSADGGLAALLAVARLGGKPHQEECLKALGKWPLATLSERQQVDKLRVVQVSLARNGQPSPAIVDMAVSRLSASYPSASERVNRELSQVLIALGAPDVVGKSLALMKAARTQEDLMHYLFHLRTAKHWTPEQRREYIGYWSTDFRNMRHPAEVLRWFDEAGRPYSDGASFGNFLKNFAKDAAAHLSDTEKAEFEPAFAQLGAPTPKPASRKNPSGTDFPAAKPRNFVKSWTVADISADLEKAGSSRNFQRGRQAFVDAQCLACHRFGNAGGGVGPDLTSVSSRFRRLDLLESIVEPDKVVSEQYQNTTVTTHAGEDHIGRLVDETPEKLVLLPNALEPARQIEIKKGDVKARAYSKLSPMPSGLADSLGKDDLLDLIAFLESGGNPNHPVFQ